MDQICCTQDLIFYFHHVNKFVKKVQYKFVFFYQLFMHCQHACSSTRVFYWRKWLKILFKLEVIKKRLGFLSQADINQSHLHRRKKDSFSLNNDISIQRLILFIMIGGFSYYNQIVLFVWNLVITYYNLLIWIVVTDK